MALPSLDPSIFKRFLYVLHQASYLMLRRDQSRTVKKLSLVYVNILYLKIYKFILLGKICGKKVTQG